MTNFFYKCVVKARSGWLVQINEVEHPCRSLNQVIRTALGNIGLFTLNLNFDN